MKSYNCHLFVRTEDIDSFKYKPNAKISFASATHSNIVLSKDCSNLELMDSSYPYYTNNDLASVINAVKFSKETFKTKIWSDALKMINNVKKRTSIKQIGKDYRGFIRKF